jgi:glycosyltransferase involved in cell wall biosynthesis
MPRVLVVTHEYSGTGAAVMLEAVLVHWARNLGWGVDLFNRFDKPRVVPESLLAAGARPVVLTTLTAYDLVLVNSIVVARLLQWCARELAARRPALLWVHEGSTYKEFASHRDLDWPAILGAFARVVFPSAWQRDAVFGALLRAAGAVSRAVVVPNGVPPLPELASLLPRDPGLRRIVFVGSLYPRKRPHDLVLAVRQLDRPDLQCLFVGPSHAGEQYSEYFRSLLDSWPNRFRLLGEMPRPQIAGVLAQADLFCLPSDSEALALSPLEAAQVDVPVCLSDLPAYADIWSHEENCLMHPVGDVAALANNLQRLLDDHALAATLASRARLLLPCFSFDNFVRSFTSTAIEAMAR